MKEQLEVRDMRNKTKFYLDDIFIDEYAILVGTTATVIYTWLCRYANKNQKAWPSLARLASNLGMNEKTIRRNLKKLENHNLILVERVGKTRSNRYHLLDQGKWIKEPPKNEKVIGHECPVTGTPMSNHSKDTQQRNKIDTNVSTASGKKDEAVQGEKENFEKPASPPDSAVAKKEPDPVNQLMQVFYEGGNPMIDFGNPFQRKAAKRIIAINGIENAIKIAKYAVSVNNKEFAQMITTPLELKNKYAKLKIYWEREKNKPGFFISKN